MNPPWVSTMTAGVFDPDSITLSSVHAGHSNGALALPSGYPITPARRRHLLQSERISFRSGKSVLGLAAYKVADGDNRVAHHFVVDRSLNPAAAQVVVDTLVVALEIAALRDQISSLALVVLDHALLPRVAAHGYVRILQNSHEVWVQKTVSFEPRDSSV